MGNTVLNNVYKKASKRLTDSTKKGEGHIL